MRVGVEQQRISPGLRPPGDQSQTETLRPAGTKGVEGCGDHLRGCGNRTEEYVPGLRLAHRRRQLRADHAEGGVGPGRVGGDQVQLVGVSALNVVRPLERREGVVETGTVRAWDHAWPETVSARGL